MTLVLKRRPDASTRQEFLIETERLGSPLIESDSPALSFTGNKAPSIVRKPAAGKMGSAEEGQLDWRSEFAQQFPDDAISAVKELTQHALLHREDAEEAASILLPYLVKSSYAQRNLVFNALMDFATPQDLLFAALSAAERHHDPRILRIAAELLEQYGTEATPVLTRLARSGRPECQYFVGTIVNLPGLPEEPKRDALSALARHPDIETRQEMLDEADRASAGDATLVYHLLAHDTDKTIRELAGERLVELES